MTYSLGIDLGTTFVAAAVAHASQVEMFTLGDRSVVSPAAVYARDDGTVVTGDAAVRRAVSSPDRVGREFKRRLGDPTPVMLGGSPYTVTTLLGTVLKDVVDRVVRTQGEPPGRVVLTHPANWGPYRRELFDEVPHLAGLSTERTAAPRMVTEPEAAAAHYAASRRLGIGDVVAVYDLGGGTFDATVLRKQHDSIEILGTPEGIERLGGVDFDEAILSFVNYTSGGALGELDMGDAQTAVALARLRQDCVLAKEALSIDSETTIPVFLPHRHFDVRITATEFEDMIRAQIESTIGALSRTLRSAQVDSGQLTAVLLVGGSSRIPLVSRMLSEELGRPIVVDTHPKYAVALGAAELARVAHRDAGPALGTTVDPYGALRTSATGQNGSGAPGPSREAAERATNGAVATAPPIAAPTGPAPGSSGGTPVGPTPTGPASTGGPSTAAYSAGTAAYAAGTAYSPGGTAPAPPGGPTRQDGGPPTGPGTGGPPPSGGAYGPPPGGAPGPPTGPQDRPAGAGPVGPGSPPPPLRRDSGDGGDGGGRGGRKIPMLAAGAVVAVLVLIAGLVFAVVNGYGPFAGTNVAAEAPPAPPGTEPAAAVPIPTLAAPIPAGPTPGFVAVSPNGRLAYVANRDAGVVTVIDTAINKTTATIKISSGPPQYLAFAPDGRRVYVSVFNNERTIAAVAVLDTRRNSVVATVPVQTRPYALAVTPDGSKVYVPNHDSGTVSVIDTATDTVSAEIKVAANPHWVSFSPDGSRAYTANHESNLITVLDTSDNSVVAEVPVGRSPHSIAVNPVRPLVANVNYDSASVSLTNTDDNQVVATVPVGVNPQAVTWSPDGHYAYVVNVKDNTVSVIDGETYAVTATIPSGNSPTSIAVLPNGKQAFVTDLNSGQLTVLDTSGG